MSPIFGKETTKIVNLSSDPWAIQFYAIWGLIILSIPKLGPPSWNVVHGSANPTGVCNFTFLNLDQNLCGQQFDGNAPSCNTALLSNGWVVKSPSPAIFEGRMSKEDSALKPNVTAKHATTPFSIRNCTRWGFHVLVVRMTFDSDWQWKFRYIIYISNIMNIIYTVYIIYIIYIV